MSERTVWGLVATAAIAVALGGVVYLAATSSHNGWRERQDQAAPVAEAKVAAHRVRVEARVQECRDAGGVPITDGWWGVLERCDFPCAQR